MLSARRIAVDGLAMEGIGAEVGGEGADGRSDRTHAEELRDALGDDQLLLLFQPKIALDGGGITGVEALVRWQHATRGLVLPGEFIPMAERTGLVVPLGAWVLDRACRQAAKWHEDFALKRRLVISVNVSTTQLEADLIGVVRRTLDRSGLPATMLRLEITESALMADRASAVDVLQELGEMGVSISVDDFGTGYSSLAYLKWLPLHELKIDRSFVEGLGTDPDSTAIVAAVIAMAHALGLTVVAEGVETAAQLEHLRILGCDEAQGFHIGRPTTASAIEAELRALRSGERPAGSRAALHHADRVLIVDDAIDVRQLARMTLVASGFDVHESTDGLEAVAAARDLRPDCVLLDVEMPGLSGFDACRMLRDQTETADCTIVMLTSKADAVDKVEAFSIGADEYIVKPFSPRDLTSRVRAALGRRRAAQPTKPGTSGT